MRLNNAPCQNREIQWCFSWFLPLSHFGPELQADKEVGLAMYCPRALHMQPPSDVLTPHLGGGGGVGRISATASHRN